MRKSTIRQNANNTSFHCSLLDAQILKDQIPQSELKQFVKLMYPNSLLVQVAHAHPWIHQNLISNSEEKENTFPQINGILSTIDSHICPAAMPTMLLYEKLNNEFVTQKYTNFQNLGEDLLREVPYSNRNREAEKSVWKNETDFFDESIELAIDNFDTLLKKNRKYFIDAYVKIQEGDIVKKYLVEVKPWKQTQEPKAGKGKKKSNLLYEQVAWKNNCDKWAFAKEFAKKHGIPVVPGSDPTTTTGCSCPARR
jgi:hypothetical protein